MRRKYFKTSSFSEYQSPPPIVGQVALLRFAQFAFIFKMLTLYCGCCTGHYNQRIHLSKEKDRDSPFNPRISSSRSTLTVPGS